MDDTTLIEVCDACLQASCWYGAFMCDAAQNAGTIMKTVAELRTLGREHPDYWSDEIRFAVYGCIPDTPADLAVTPDADTPSAPELTQP